MRANKPTHSPRERGQAIVLVMLVFVGLLGIMGLAIDGGRLYSDRRSVQNAADNAALAGAFALCGSGNPVSAAVASAAQNGYTAAPPAVTVAVHNPPTSGPHTGDDDYVEVKITAQSPLTLGRLVYRDTPVSSARAVARCTSSGGTIGGGNGLIALNPSQDKVVEMAASGCIRVNGGGIFVNSTHSNSIAFGGWGPPQAPCTEPRMRADWLQFRGGYTGPSWLTPSSYMTPFPPQGIGAAMTDPLATVPVPPVPGNPATPVPARCGTNPLFLNGNVLDLPASGWVNCSVITIKPGLYEKICIGSDANVVMEPGLYYITGNSDCGWPGGAFSVGGAAQVNGTGVMIYIANRSFQVVGSGNVTLTAPTSGSYQGMALFMSRDMGAEIKVSGGGTTMIRGTIYGANSRVIMEGSGNNKTLNAQLIAWRYYVSGNGYITVDYDAGVVFGGGGSSIVELSE